MSDVYSKDVAFVGLQNRFIQQFFLIHNEHQILKYLLAILQLHHVLNRFLKLQWLTNAPNYETLRVIHANKCYFYQIK